MAIETKRGSDKLMAAWKARVLTEESVREIAAQFAKSPASVEAAAVVGGADATGVRLSVAYRDEDTEQCGNDILFWLKWHRTHGGEVRPPRIIIDGIPYPDFLRMELDFGQVGNVNVEQPGLLAGAGQLAGQIGG